MKKKLLLVFVGLVGVFTVFVYWLTQTGGSKLPMSQEEKAAAAYVESFGYTIKKRLGEGNPYKMEPSLLRSGSDNLPYIHTWSVQKAKPEKYYGKHITSYRFTVSGHPLDKLYGTDTRVSVMMADGQVIGGTSFPDKEDLAGSAYSVEGYTLEEITGLSFSEWRTRWAETYGN